MPDEDILVLIREALLYAAPDKKTAIEGVTWTSSLSALGVDSIGLLEASAYIEEKLDASFPDDKLAKVDKVGDFGDLIRDHVRSSATV